MCLLEVSVAESVTTRNSTKRGYYDRHIPLIHVDVVGIIVDNVGSCKISQR